MARPTSRLGVAWDGKGWEKKRREENENENENECLRLFDVGVMIVDRQWEGGRMDGRMKGWMGGGRKVSLSAPLLSAPLPFFLALLS